MPAGLCFLLLSLSVRQGAHCMPWPPHGGASPSVASLSSSASFCHMPPPQLQQSLQGLPCMPSSLQRSPESSPSSTLKLMHEQSWFAGWSTQTSASLMLSRLDLMASGVVVVVVFSLKPLKPLQPVSVVLTMLSSCMHCWQTHCCAATSKARCRGQTHTRQVGQTARLSPHVIAVERKWQSGGLPPPPGLPAAMSADWLLAFGFLLQTLHQ